MRPVGAFPGFAKTAFEIALAEMENLPAGSHSILSKCGERLDRFMAGFASGAKATYERRARL